MERVLTPGRSIDMAPDVEAATPVLANLLRVVGRTARLMTSEVALLAA